MLNRAWDGVAEQRHARFSDVARRLGAAARAAGLVVPAFRSPPRTASACRTIRRLPGGPVVAVRIKARPFADVVVDMVDGVIAANRLDGAGPRCAYAATLLRRGRRSVAGATRPGWRNRQTQAA